MKVLNKDDTDQQ